MKLSPHFDLSEFVFSQTAVRLGISNYPPEKAIDNLAELCHNVLEPLREQINKPIRISSGYRSPELNKAIGGASTSQHQTGNAVDLTVHGWTVNQVYHFIKHSAIDFDQLIEEFADSPTGGWIHISYVEGNNRQECLIATKKDGKTVYTKD